MPLDIGWGIIAAIMVSKIGLLPLNWTMIAAAAAFALLPDVDFLLYAFRRDADEFSHEHRDLLHNPLLFVPIGFVIIAPFSSGFAWLFVLCAVGHFLHDSVGMGWGVRWRYPFSRRYYKFFSDKRGKMSSNVITSWTPEEQRAAAREFGNPHWMRDYLMFSPELIIEILFFAAAVMALAILWYR